MEKEYDFVIIGSGLGGLECGLILASEGHSVCILEKNKQLGGSLQVFSREKTIFDTGVHYIGGLDKGQNLYRYFKYFGIMDDLKLIKMDVEGTDVVTFEGDPKEYAHPQGYDRFIETMTRNFPEEREAIVTYCNEIKRICDQFPLYHVDYNEGNVLDEKLLSINTKDFIASLTTNSRLRDVLAGTNALYAGIADKTPLYVHALVVNSYIESAYRCVDGGSQIAILLARQVRKHGGEIFKHCEVTHLNIEDGLVTAAHLQDGRVVRGKKFISNAHPKTTLSWIDPGGIKKSFRNRINRMQNTVSSFTVHIVCKPESFPYINHNYYHLNGENAWSTVDYDPTKWPESYMLCTPATAKSPEYAKGVTIMAYMKFEEVEKWANTFNTVSQESSRGTEYEAFKKEKEELLIAEVEKRFPTIRQSIQSVHSSTPLSFRDYIGNGDGSLYGVVKDYKNPLLSFLTPKTKIANLYMTGQNLNLHGMLGVTVSSIVTCSEFIDKKTLIEKVREASDT